MKTFFAIYMAITALIAVGSYGTGILSRDMVDTVSYERGYAEGVAKARGAAFASYDGDFELEHGKVEGTEDYQQGFAAGHQNGYGRGVHACQYAVDAVHLAAKLTRAEEDAR